MRRATATSWTIAALLSLTGCAALSPPDVSVPATSATPDAGGASPGSAAPTGSTARADELASGVVKHEARSGDLTVEIEYTAPTPVSWTSDGGTAVEVVASVREAGEPRRKVYVTRASLRSVVRDGSTVLPPSDPVVDVANISPGYLATNPYAYSQTFSVPAVDRSARELDIVLKLDLLTLVDPKARDYTKRSVTDTVRTVVAG